LASWGERYMHLHATLQHTDWVWTVALSPDGHTVLTGSKDTTARRWDVHTGAAVGEPLRHDDPVWAAAFSPHGRFILTGSGSRAGTRGEARLWAARTGHPVTPPLPHSGQVIAALFAPDGQTFLTACDNLVHVWKTPAGEVQPAPAPLLTVTHACPVFTAV